MKTKLKIWYPVTATNEREIELDIPDDIKEIEHTPEDWIYENMYSILTQNGADDFESFPLNRAIDLGYAGVEIIK